MPAETRALPTTQCKANCAWQGLTGVFRLQGVQRALLPAASAATSGHVTLLKQKALTGILRRLDALLFGKLLSGEFLIMQVMVPHRCVLGIAASVELGLCPTKLP